jgi:hypothetical protein
MAKVYLDSCMIIGLIEGDATQRRLLKAQLINHSIYSSELARFFSLPNQAQLGSVCWRSSASQI